MNSQTPALQVLNTATLPTAYAPVRPSGPIDLWLDANEAIVSCVDIASVLASIMPDSAARYPSVSPLEISIAQKLGLPSSRILVTAGGDEAIDRACRAFLNPGAEIIIPTPTFEMIERYAQMAQAKVVPVAWRDGPFPVEAVLNQVNQRTAMIAIVSPNNPTGAVAQVQDIQRISAAAPHAQLLVDLAYEEFADVPLTTAAATLPNTIIIRTFSKAFGLAGMRVGYAIASELAIKSMRAAGSPYSVSALSIAAAQQALDLPDTWLAQSVSRVHKERSQLQELLRDLGAVPAESQGNFVLAQFSDAQRAQWVWRALAGLGIAVRRFTAKNLENYLRITCPGHAPSFERLKKGLLAAIRPRTIVCAPVQFLDTDSETLKRLSARISIAPITPSPPQLGSLCGWMICDSLELIAAARNAGLVPIAIAPQNSDGSELERGGAARVLTSLSQLEGMLP